MLFVLNMDMFRPTILVTLKEEAVTTNSYTVGVQNLISTFSNSQPTFQACLNKLIQRPIQYSLGIAGFDVGAQVFNS